LLKKEVKTIDNAFRFGCSERVGKKEWG